MGLLDDLKNSVVNGDPAAARELAQKALQSGLTFEKIMSEALIPGIHDVGDKFGRGEMYLPELLVSGMAMKGAVEVLKPLGSDPGIKTAGKALIATVQGDLHDIGKKIVGMMLEGAGFEVVDLGIDIPSDKVVKAVQDMQAQLVCLSSLLTTTMPAMKAVIQGLERAGIRKRVKVMVGGAPITQKFADEIGADGYAPDAPSAVRKAEEILA
jgi:5-methyltetrahydrofolate--homocysteine methyltransferase